jgi:acetyl-CoA C-acetyltransferase
VHDCFTIAEILAMEDLGFFEKGKAAAAITAGKTTLGKQTKLVVNPSGGLKGCGHPVGATGVKQVVEIVTQLRGQAGARQVKKTKIGLTHNVGGSGATAVVHILKI